jgi:pimeloyl-ACP methyl ester carboxylesterase
VLATDFDMFSVSRADGRREMTHFATPLVYAILASVEVFPGISMKRFSLSGFRGRNRRHALLGVAVFFVILGTFVSISGERRSMNFSRSAHAQEYVFVSCEEAREEDGMCETDEDIYIWGDITLEADVEYHIAKEIYIEEGGTLTIEPGVRVLFSKPEAAGYSSLGVRLIGGTLIAEGTSEDPIIFGKTNGETIFTLFFLGGDATLDHVRIESGGMGEAEEVFLGWLRNLVGTAYADSTWNVQPAIWYEQGSVTIRNSVFSGSGGADIFIPGDDQKQSFEYVPGSTLLVEHSDFNCKTDVPALFNADECVSGDSNDIGCEPIVTLRNNWYGDASGPRVLDHYGDRSGKEVIGLADIDGFALEPYIEERCASNILFLPGIKASRLYMNTDHGTVDKLWPPTFFSDDISGLALDEDGGSMNPVYTEDIIESVPLASFYKSFIDDLEQKEEEYVINDFLPFAYDWRMSVRDVAYGQTPYRGDYKSLFQETQNLSESSKSGKVTIIAHSNGGLVAKALLMRLEEQGITDIIDRVIFVGTPQIGTPKSILSLLYGYDEELVGGFLASRENVRKLAENMPGAYGLLPTEEYFDRTEEPIVSFSEDSEHTRVKAYYDAYGGTIDDRDELEAFLAGEGDDREKPEKGRIDLENILRRNLLNLARYDQGILDDWVPPAEIEVIQIAGWGLDTISGIRYAEKEKVYCHPYIDSYCVDTGEYEVFYEPVFTIDGDEVVTSPSALMLLESENVKRYWVDLWDFRQDPSPNRDHADILEMSYLRDFLFQLITNNANDLALPDYISTSRPPDHENAKPRIRMSLYSPLDVSLVDKNGNRTGTVRIEESGEEYVIYEQHIPGSSFFNFDERKYASFPAGEPIDIRLEGYADGAYTLRFEEIKLTQTGEKTVSHTTFEHLPTTADTTVTLSVPQEGLSGLTPLSADIDGDGDPDYTVEPVPNGIATLEQGENDTIPPTTNIEVSGTEGENGWYMDSVSVTISADDGPDGSGVAATEYSLDESESWETYIEPFTISEGGGSYDFLSFDGRGRKY